ncbi:hypothetical protein [Desulfococcus sp.]|uniref:hypothetical protein n=1 Tax=Desulfococcus sp. TaxID=2025834 RepID=UPI0035944EFE
MILNPAIITLILTALLTALFAIYASTLGYRILRDWDIESDSEGQLALEKQTYLVSSVLTHLFAIGLFSMFFFVYTADRIHPLFTGAMCAAGSLNVNKYGYPVLVVKLAAAVLSGLWLILNHADNQCPDYPLIKPKYRLLFAVTALCVFDAYLVTQYFLNMKANILTSCCGILFNAEAGGVMGSMAALPSVPAKILFYLSLVLTLRAGIHFRITGRSASLFAGFSALFFLVSIVSIISFISLYFYELPTHHCPFCLLQREYHYIGYPLYTSLLTAGIAGMGVGMLERVRGPESLERRLPSIQQRLCLVAMIGFFVFAAISTWPMVFSDFILEGY